MAETDSTRIKHYLYNEMPDNERKEFEDQLFTSDELFYDVVDRENELVDQYVKKKLSTDDIARFEKSLNKVPSRRTKIANAAAIQRLIEEERPVTATEPERSSTVATWFSFFGPNRFAYSAGGLILLFALSTIYLFVDNRRRGEEMTQLTAEIANSSGASASELQRQLDALKERETAMGTQIDAEKSVSGDLTADLASERETRRKLEKEITELRKLKPDAPKPSPDEASRPSIATIILKPDVSGEMRPLGMNAGVKRVSVLLTLPAETGPGERFTVRLNGRTIAENLPVRAASNGTKTVSVTIVEKDLQPGENRITANDKAGTKVSEYVLTTAK